MERTAILNTAASLVLAGAIAAPLSAEAQGLGKIEEGLLARAEQSGSATYLVYFKQRADLSRAFTMTDADARGLFVYDELKRAAEQSQARALEYLRTQRLAGRVSVIKRFLSINAVGVVSGDQPLRGVAGLAEVERITSAPTLTVPEPVPGAEEATVDGIEWGVARVGAPGVWAEGFRGGGVVVANIDTGVQFDHPALIGQYRGNLGASFDHSYNWWDPSQVCGTPSLAPCDNNGHGSHTMGTMIGDDGGANQIGVAPDASWIACKGCESGSCSSFALLECADFILAPWDLSGANPDPTRRPHVVNNSWGSLFGGDAWYMGAVDAWIAAGIFPAFSNGNSGPFCRTSGSPGDYPQSFSSGASDINDGIATFSSRGPSSFGGVSKPDITAPGVNVRSSVPPNSYSSFSGTSMASPHTAGMVALLWSQYPNLVRDIDSTANKLRPAARITNATQGCGGDGPTDHPNNVFGWGIADAFAAHSPFNIYTDRSIYSAGETAFLDFSLVSPFDSTILVDLYIAVRAPNGQLLFFPDFQPVQVPWQADFSLDSSLELFDVELLSELIDAEPGGAYNWFAVMVPPGGDPTDPAQRLSLDTAPMVLDK